MSYHCPGLHGAGACKQDVGRRSFGDLLAQGRPQLRIPPFQRAYCWDQSLAKGWWRDCQLGAHSTGKAIFSPTACIDDQQELLVIDGQQRLTTTCLLLAAIRDEALKSIGSVQAPDAAQIIGICEAALFSDRNVAYAWMKEKKAVIAAGAASWEVLLPADDAVLPFFSLLPTLRDRAAFAQLLLGRRLGLALTTAQCAMTHVKGYFDSVVAGRSVARLSVDLRCALDGMSLMAVTLVRPPAGLPQQVYLWAQERSLAASIEISNPSPGVWLTVADLLRNLLLAPLLDRPVSEMESILRRVWLPLELRFDSPPSFDAFLASFVKASPRATITDAAQTMLSAATGVESLLGSCELSFKFRLYGHVVAEYDAIAAATEDKLKRIEMLAHNLLRFAESGSKVPTQTADLQPNDAIDLSDAMLMPPPHLPMRCR